MKVLVTGGSGFIGHYVVPYLEKREYEVVVFDKKPDTGEGVPYLQGDILDHYQVWQAMREMDAVVHMAEVPGPRLAPSDEVLKVNTQGVANALSAAHDNGIKKFIFISSMAVYGFQFEQESVRPKYVPVDEEHPADPQDDFGKSKKFGEDACREYAEKGMQTVVLRVGYVWSEKNAEMLMEMVNDPEMWDYTLWAYVHVLDLAQAIDLSLRKDLPSDFEVFLINAGDNGGRSESSRLKREFYKETPCNIAEFTGTEPFVSIKKAVRVLGYEPKHSWRDLE